MGRVLDRLGDAGLLNPGRIGIIVSCDPPLAHIEAMFDGKLAPVAVVFRWTHKHAASEEQYPTREVTEEEAVAIVNKYLAEGRIQFGFQKTGAPPVPPGMQRIKLT
jgi:hypothetical protein